MTQYRWQCKACHQANEATLTHCAHCGCDSMASTDDVERHQDKDKHSRQLALEVYKDRATSFFVSVLALFTLAVAEANTLLYWFLVAFIPYIAYKQHELIQYFLFSIKSRWLTAGFGLVSLCYLGMMSYLIMQDHRLSIAHAIPLVIFAVTFRYLVFNSHWGKEHFNAYFDQVIQPKLGLDHNEAGVLNNQEKGSSQRIKEEPSAPQKGPNG
uniref:hypothetical protein n=1 Tax=Thaumasiovibrio occultus TaxID=1891184 RepID=UPI000B35E9EB|nr:hypothetical protein [Thaumasiovibrio occultus]